MQDAAVSPPRASRRGSPRLVTRLTVLKDRLMLLDGRRVLRRALDGLVAPRVVHDQVLLDAGPAQPGWQRLLVVGTGRHADAPLQRDPSGECGGVGAGEGEMSKLREVNDSVAHWRSSRACGEAWNRFLRRYGRAVPPDDGEEGVAGWS